VVVSVVRVGCLRLSSCRLDPGSTGPTQHISTRCHGPLEFSWPGPPAGLLPSCPGHGRGRLAVEPSFDCAARESRAANPPAMHFCSPSRVAPSVHVFGRGVRERSGRPLSPSRPILPLGHIVTKVLTYAQDSIFPILFQWYGSTWSLSSCCVRT